MRATFLRNVPSQHSIAMFRSLPSPLAALAALGTKIIMQYVTDCRQTMSTPAPPPTAAKAPGFPSQPAPTPPSSTAADNADDDDSASPSSAASLPPARRWMEWKYGKAEAMHATQLQRRTKSLPLSIHYNMNIVAQKRRRR
mmetsp:Transcript_30768/g.52533  ORF Transcript_30768/g.52533 Transcript_30768/m.52533 type:complete len:141 (+) Transcript_30768:134-556(+)